MWDLNEVTEIKYAGGYRYYVVFDDGASGEVDFSEYLARGPMFEPLRDVNFFKRARIEGGTIAWPNGADVTPESLYEKVSRRKDVVADEATGAEPQGRQRA